MNPQRLSLKYPLLKKCFIIKSLIMDSIILLITLLLIIVIINYCYKYSYNNNYIEKLHTVYLKLYKPKL